MKSYKKQSVSHKSNEGWNLRKKGKNITKNTKQTNQKQALKSSGRIKIGKKNLYLIIKRFHFNTVVYHTINFSFLMTEWEKKWGHINKNTRQNIHCVRKKTCIFYSATGLLPTVWSLVADSRQSPASKTPRQCCLGPTSQVSSVFVGQERTFWLLGPAAQQRWWASECRLNSFMRPFPSQKTQSSRGVGDSWIYLWSGRTLLYL